MGQKKWKKKKGKRSVVRVAANQRKGGREVFLYGGGRHPKYFFLCLCRFVGFCGLLLLLLLLLFSLVRCLWGLLLETPKRF